MNNSFDGSFDRNKDELLDLIAEAVNLKNLDRSTIFAATPIMGEGLALDSIDILEVVIALEKKYNVKIASDASSRMIFKDFGSLADFVQNQKNSPAILDAD